MKAIVWIYQKVYDKMIAYGWAESVAIGIALWVAAQPFIILLSLVVAFIKNKG